MSCLIRGFHGARAVWVCLGVITVALGVTSSIRADEPPIIDNVIAQQRTDGSRLVDVWYMLSDPDGNPSTIGLEAKVLVEAWRRQPIDRVLPKVAVGNAPVSFRRVSNESQQS